MDERKAFLLLVMGKVAQKGWQVALFVRYFNFGQAASGMVFPDMSKNYPKFLLFNRWEDDGVSCTALGFGGRLLLTSSHR